MKLVVTGGGTGGHVFPALEVALSGRERGWEVTYLGSIRGQESRACEQAKLPFQGFPSEPVYFKPTLQGIRSVFRLMAATGQAQRYLAQHRPDVLFATGGYAAAPVVQAAKKLRIPYVLHEQNTVPGRTNKLLSERAYAVCTTFHASAKHIHHKRMERTGLPIRKPFRDGGQGRLMLDSKLPGPEPLILVMGGSQGSAPLNELVLSTAIRMTDTKLQWLHITGLKNFEKNLKDVERMGLGSNYTVKSYLDAEEMACALFQADLVICRSGAGTLAELAAMRKPSILVPFPQAFANHQYFNALEFCENGAAELVEQKSILPANLEARIIGWLEDKERVKRAESALMEWDVPDATERILAMIEQATADANTSRKRH